MGGIIFKTLLSNTFIQSDIYSYEIDKTLFNSNSLQTGNKNITIELKEYKILLRRL